ncbi:MAG: hypothetical protein K0R51_75 [Cytophagaceae bacterium]|jgi:DNA-binding transcriptional regulator YhcF (GntR family)|nr:hypothetical protein [Cytophagaceae bacterium]
MTEDALYLKVVNHLCDKIVRKELASGAWINKYEYAFDNGVSKHIVGRALDYLSERDILKPEASLFSVTDNAYAKAKAYRKEKVLTQELYPTFELLSMLSISPEEFLTAYQQHLASHS